jgi:CheY-like chemotaxis protein
MPSPLPELALDRFDGLATVVIEREPYPLAGAAVGTVDLLLDDLIAPPSATAAERTAHRATLTARRGGGGREVLVVETSTIARKFLIQRLESLGYDVHAAENGTRALAMVEHLSFSIVFTELTLEPGELDGLALCHAIKQKTDHPRGIAPAVVVVAGRASSADRVRASMAGCDAFLKKPLAEEPFTAALCAIDPLFS